MILGNIFGDNGFGIDVANTVQASVNNVDITSVIAATPVVIGQPVPMIDKTTGDVVVPSGTPSGVYTIGYTICLPSPNGNICDSATVTITVTPENNEDIVIYNHMTPNEDGYNDVFYIDNINKFPNNTVEVYNRWGVLVFETKGYNNNDKSFKGESKGRVTINQREQLPEGTYYYIIRYTNTSGISKEKAGYLYINR